MLPTQRRPHRRSHSPRSARRLGAAILSVALAVTVTAGFAAPATASKKHDPDLGRNTIVFDPSMPIATIQAKVDAIHAQQVDAEMGDGRYALLFKPGTYGTAEHPLRFQVGYYTEVAGLGLKPGDVKINGAIEVYNRCLPTAPGEDSNCIALVNFWRSLSNLSINFVGGGDGCRDSANFWAVSQAAPMRRVELTGANLSLMDYCTAGPQYASGGFIADSKLPFVVSGSQQQFLTRNSSVEGWSNFVWNQVFSGVEGAPEGGAFTDDNKYTTLAATPLSREKPFLYVDGKGKWNVFVPDAVKSSTGTSWKSGSAKGKSISLDKFYVAKPGDDVKRINLELLKGKNLLLTPGIYHNSKPITVVRPDQVVLGLGLATIVPEKGSIGLQTLDVKGVKIAGIMFDAGAKNSPALLKVGTALSKLDGLLKKQHLSDPKDPTTLSDVFFRIGGAHVGKATQSLVVNANDVVIDHTWAWRADHGVGGVGWDVNTAETGVLVNGNDVLATGLFAEHYQKYNVVWNGERGKTIFFQNELPYDAPNQAAWRHGSTLGWAAYKVDDKVKTHEAWGLGSYIYTNVDPTLHATNAIEVPKRSSVKLYNMIIVSLNNAGTIDHVVNGVGGPAIGAPGGSTTAYLAEYPTP
ncbi:MAG TPA: adenylyl cyclase [Cellulomonas sp.]|nr:adenylyl cyclase [Cellulomonas sp.]